MKLNYLIMIGALLGAAYYFGFIPGKPATPAPTVTKLDPGRVRSFKAMIRDNERMIAELEDQSVRAQKNTANDSYAINLRNQKIEKLREENSRLEAKLAAGQ